MNGSLLCATKGINIIKDDKIEKIKLDGINVWKFLKFYEKKKYNLAGTKKGLF